MTDRLTVIVSSKRLAGCIKMVDSLNETATGDFNLMIACRVSDFQDYNEAIGVKPHVQLFPTPDNNTPRENGLIVLDHNKCEHIFTFADDGIMLTKGWDELLLNAMWSDNIGVVWPCTQNPDGKVLRHCFIMMLTKTWLKTVGYWSWDKFINYYVDPFIQTVGEKIGRAKCVDGVVWLHAHKDDEWSKGLRNKAGTDREMFYSMETKQEIERVAKLLRMEIKQRSVEWRPCTGCQPSL